MRLRRLAWPFLATVALVAVLVLAVFPTPTFLAQRAATQAAEEQLSVLSEQNAALEARTRQLQRDEEIERIAREQYNLVRPGEEAYAVLPPPRRRGDGPAAIEDSPGNPTGAEAEADHDRNLLERAWDTVTGLF